MIIRILNNEELKINITLLYAYNSAHKHHIYNETNQCIPVQVRWIDIRISHTSFNNCMGDSWDSVKGGLIMTEQVALHHVHENA